MAEEDENLDFDPVRAAALVGKSVLIGLTYLDANGEVEEQIQFFGHITSVDPSIVTIKRDSGEEFTLPPALEAFEDARPGEYRLRNTGDVIVDPDLISTWTITSPSTDESNGDEN
jgi:hypothetical protein